MTVPPASDPWAGLVPDLPEPLGGLPAVAPDLPDSALLDATATARLAGPAPTRGGVPVGPRRTNVLLKVVVSVLAVLLAGGTAAVLIDLLNHKSSGPDKSGTAAQQPQNPGTSAAVGGSGVSSRTSPPAAATATTGDAPAGDTATKRLAAGAPLLLDDGQNQVRITVDRIAVHRGPCGGVGFKPDNGYYVTARVTYTIVKGSGSVDALNFAYLGTDGSSSRQVGSGFTGCGGTDLPVAASNPAGTTHSGYIGFDGPAHGTITYTGLGLAATAEASWPVG